MFLRATASLPFLSALSLGLVAAPAKAQRIYLDEVLAHAGKGTATFYLEQDGPQPEGGFAARIFSMEGTLKATGSYADETYRLPHGHFVFFHPNGAVESEGNYNRGHKDGVWTRKDANGLELAERIYDAAPLKNLVYTRAESMPRYPGGEKAMVRHVQERVGKTRGDVLANFIVEKDGRISGLEVVGTKDRELAEEIASAIRTAPLWEAGTEAGQPVRVQMRVPLK